MKSSIPVLFSLTIVCLGTPAGAAAITADFTDGTGTTLVDQYTGTAGNGWAGAWSPTGTPKSTFPKVLSASPLSVGGGNYLQVQSEAANTAAGVSRQWANATVAYSDAFSTSFKFRLDGFGDLNSTSDMLAIYEGASLTDSSFRIYAFGAANGGLPTDTWGFYNGARNDAAFGSSKLVNTGIALTIGTVYTFTVNVDPATRSWTASINDGTSSFTSGTLGFNTSSTSVDGFLNFMGQGSFSTDDPRYSIDSINIASVPEPSSGMLAVIGLAGVLAKRKRSLARAQR